MVWRIEDPQGNETLKVKYELVRYTRGIGLDMGCGPHKIWPHALGVDNCKDTELFGIEIKPDVNCDVSDPADVRDKLAANSVPYVFSSHCLEHIEDHEAALAAWWELVQVDGYLILYLPHADLYPRIGTAGSNPDHKHDFKPDDIRQVMAEIAVNSRQGWDLIRDEVREEGREYSFLQVYRKRGDEAVTFGVDDEDREHDRCIVIRHGGIGDQIQASWLFPGLKRAGYHLTVCTTPAGREPIAHDPHVDDWFMIDKDQVPNGELGPFWKALEKEYDHVVNLNESVEGLWLALPGRIQHIWPQRLRHKMLNHNYAEWAADLADIPFVPEGQFYPTAEETAWADALIEEWRRELNARQTPNREQRRRMGTEKPNLDALGDPYLVVFPLSGSSPHKFSPHQDAIIFGIMKRLARAIVVTTGDYATTILEAGLEAAPRVKCMAGKLSVRQTLTLAARANVVIGPETGVMSSVAYAENILKVVMLSHSSRENLTKHWKNTVAVEGGSDCYPCHQLHYDTTYCPTDKTTGAAMCQQLMNPDDCYRPIDAHYVGWAKAMMLREAVPA